MRNNGFDNIKIFTTFMSRGYLFMRPYIAAIITIFVVLQSSSTVAQYKQHAPFRDYYTSMAVGKERVWQRIYIGVGKHILGGSMTLHYTGRDTSGVPFDTTYTRKIRSRHSFMVHGGTFFPFVLISDNSILAFSVEFLGSYVDLTHDSVLFHSKAVYKSSESIIMLGIPVSIDFKSGADVPLNKNNKTMFSLGGGLFFGGTNRYTNNNTQQFPFLPIPFIKAEAGFFAGIAFKLRGAAYFGKSNLIDRPTGNIFADGDVMETKTSGGYGYHVSLVLMPFSYSWNDDSWH